MISQTFKYNNATRGRLLLLQSSFAFQTIFFRSIFQNIGNMNNFLTEEVACIQEIFVKIWMKPHLDKVGLLLLAPLSHATYVCTWLENRDWPNQQKNEHASLSQSVAPHPLPNYYCLLIISKMFYTALHELRRNETKWQSYLKLS